MTKVRSILLLTIVGGAVALSACSTVKTKADCVQECHERGAEYAGISPGAKESSAGKGWGTEDVCQCR